MNIDLAKNSILEKGYALFTDYYEISPSMINNSLSIMSEGNYKGGKSKRTTPSMLQVDLKKLVVNDKIQQIFQSLCENIQCQEVFLTHDYKFGEMERNMWLHFDRLRCLKAMVYLSDVSENSGPFSIVPGSHKIGHLLRQGFRQAPSYEEKKNRIKLDYPHVYEEPTQICGKKGTLILFDSDVFHLGGLIKEKNERVLIRSHWYPDMNWRINS